MLQQVQHPGNIFGCTSVRKWDTTGSLRTKSEDLVEVLNMADEVMTINLAYCFEYIFFKIPPGFLILQNDIEKQRINGLRQ